MTIQEYFQYYKEKSKEVVYPDNNQELWDVHVKILSYCRFDINIIGKYLEELVSIIENKEYKVEMKRHKYKHPNMKFNSNGPVISFEDCISDTAYLYPITMNDEEITNDLYYFNENKISIINSIKDGFNIEKGIIDVFYDDRSTTGYHCTIHHDKFPYLKDFFENLVNVRIEKQSNELTDEEIRAVMLETIETNKLNSNKTK